MHRTPFKNLVPPAPTLQLTEQRVGLLVVDFQVFAAERSAGLGRLAAERGLEDELEEYYLAADVLERVRKGQEPVHAAADVRRDLGLDD